MEVNYPERAVNSPRYKVDRDAWEAECVGRQKKTGVDKKKRKQEYNLKP